MIDACLFQKKKKWDEIAKSSSGASSCKESFEVWLAHFRNQLIADEENKVKRPHRIEESPGSYSYSQKTMGAFAMTSVLKDSAVIKFKEYFMQYKNTTDSKFGLDFSVNPDEVKFGYWGDDQDLDYANSQIKKLYPNDQKSEKMLPLAKSTWHEILSLSPAEPGLARLKEFPSNSELVSAGGWSDLHPSLFLRSLGCKNVIYVTRINGETVFGQGVIKRLLGLDTPTWKQIDPEGGVKTRQRNNNGDKSDISSLWAKLYNIANPQSSFALSIAEADAVWCTDWDSYSITDGYKKIIDHGYREGRIHFNNSSSELFGKAAKSMKAAIISESEANDISLGWPKFTGCVPYESSIFKAKDNNN